VLGLRQVPDIDDVPIAANRTHTQFAVAAGIAAVALLAQIDRSRGAVQRTIDGASVVVAALLIIFSLATDGAAVVWLSFGLALGIVALAFAGLSGTRGVELADAAPASQPALVAGQHEDHAAIARRVI
jgi:hypothetical protein